MTMSSGQYELKRREDSDNKKEKAGLELNVIDHYNGSERSVKTLSGGKPFRHPCLLLWGFRMKFSPEPAESAWMPCL